MELIIIGIAGIIVLLIISIEIFIYQRKILTSLTSYRKETPIELLKYNEELLNYLKSITTEITIIEFKNMIRGLNLESSNIRNLAIERIASAATNVFIAIDKDRLYESHIMSTDFYNNYIIGIATLTMEELIIQMLGDNENG